MKLISWNVNGVRAIARKSFFDDLKSINPDVLCLQETKATEDQVKEVFKEKGDYFIYANSANRPGYSGTATVSKIRPVSVTKGINVTDHDNEGRVLTLEFEKFFLINVYVPNSGSELKRLEYRQNWDLAFFSYLKKLEKIKPVVACGDFNVAHKNIDLARPKANYNKYAGFMQEEIDGMDRYTEGGLADTFRKFNPDVPGRYTWWSYRAGAREKNIGWRIDYFLASESFLPSIKKVMILDQVKGSDHCPVGIEIK